MKLINNTRVGGILFLMFSVGYGYYATQIPLDFFSQQEAFNARSMPQFLGVCGVIVSALLIVLPSQPTDWRSFAVYDWIRPPALLLLMWGYASGFEMLGFGLSTLLFLLLAFMMLGERNWLRMIGVAVPLVLGFWLLMHQLGIYLSPGELLAPYFSGETS